MGHLVKEEELKILPKYLGVRWGQKKVHNSLSLVK